MKLILGASGWSYNEWVGSFYKTKTRKFSQYTKRASLLKPHLLVYLLTSTQVKSVSL
jgi:hypothetical protein